MFTVSWFWNGIFLLPLDYQSLILLILITVVPSKNTLEQLIIPGKLLTGVGFTQVINVASFCQVHWVSSFVLDCFLDEKGHKAVKNDLM